MEFWLDKAPELWVKTLEHLLLTGVSTGFAILIGLPLGIWITRNAGLRGIVLAVSGTVQTIPSLAMLAFLLPVLGIGIKPALVALTLYAILPIIRNTYTGLREISAEILEAADGMGFTGRQRLRMVEIPLALPMIVAGVRTATVIGVGIATLSAFIGAGGLGDFINRGLALNHNGLILLGAVPAAALALVLDFAVGTVEILLRPGRRLAETRRRAVVSVFVLAAFSLTALLLFTRQGGPTDESFPDRRPRLRIGTKNFTEQLILGEMVAQQIERATGVEVDRRFNLGGTILCHRALINGEIDLYPEYTGTGLTAILGQEKESDPDACFALVARAYRERFACEWFAPFGFNSTYAITVRGRDAVRQGWSRISDLEQKAPELEAGFTAEFSERPDGYPGLRQAYGFSFGKVLDLDPGLMYKAVSRGEVDVICAFSTDGRIEAYDLAVLQDDRNFFPPYYAAPVVHAKALEVYPELRDALAPLAGVLSDRIMQGLNFQVDEKGRSPEEVVGEFLGRRGSPGPSQPGIRSSDDDAKDPR